MIKRNGIIDANKQTVFLDVDDVILRSSDAMIELLNEKYRRPLGLEDRTHDDLKDWGYYSIYNGPERKENPNLVEKLFDSDCFWNIVKFHSGFEKLCENSRIINGYNWIFVTKGNDRNLEHKEKFLFNNPKSPIYFRNHGSKFSYYGLQLKECKSWVDMKNGIQVDDRLDNLQVTNASVKILMKNGIDTDYNGGFGKYKGGMDNLYIVNYFDEIESILEFNLDCKLFDNFILDFPDLN